MIAGTSGMSDHRSRLPPGLAGPLYLQVADAMLQRIVDNEWAEGQPLPSEIDLSVELGVSVGTMRKSMQQLEKIGAISRQRGRGTFVRPSFKDRDPHAFRLFWCENKAVNLEFDEVSVRAAVANAMDAQNLQAPIGAPVYKVERIARANRKAKVFQEVTVLQSVAGDLSEQALSGDASLYEIYRGSKGFIVTAVDDRVWAESSGEFLEGKLGIPQGQPVLAIERVSYDGQNRVLDRRSVKAVLKDCEYGGAVAL